MDKISILTEKVKTQKQLEQQKTLPAKSHQILSDKLKTVLTIYPNQLQFITEMNHSNCIIRYRKIKTVLDCLKFDSIKLSDLKLVYNENTPFQFLRSWLLQLNLFVNVESDKKLSEDQIIELSRYMYDEIFLLNMAEITLLFERIKTGFYFQFYNRIDATQIISACRSYRKERSKHLIEVEQENQWNKHLYELDLKCRNEYKKKRKLIISKRNSRYHNRIKKHS